MYIYKSKFWEYAYTPNKETVQSCSLYAGSDSLGWNFSSCPWRLHGWARYFVSLCLRFLGLLWGSNELIYGKCLMSSEYQVNVVTVFTIVPPLALFSFAITAYLPLYGFPAIYWSTPTFGFQILLQWISLCVYFLCHILEVVAWCTVNTRQRSCSVYFSSCGQGLHPTSAAY